MGDLAGTLVPGSSAARPRAEAEPDLFLNRYSLESSQRLGWSALVTALEKTIEFKKFKNEIWVRNLQVTEGGRVLLSWW